MYGHMLIVTQQNHSAVLLRPLASKFILFLTFCGIDTTNFNYYNYYQTPTRTVTIAPGITILLFKAIW